MGLVQKDQAVYQCVAENDIGSAQASAQLIVESSGNFYFFNNLLRYSYAHFSDLIVNWFYFGSLRDIHCIFKQGIASCFMNGFCFLRLEQPSFATIQPGDFSV